MSDESELGLSGSRSLFLNSVRRVLSRCGHNQTPALFIPAGSRTGWSVRFREAVLELVPGIGIPSTLFPFATQPCASRRLATQRDHMCSIESPESHPLRVCFLTAIASTLSSQRTKDQAQNDPFSASVGSSRFSPLSNISATRCFRQYLEKQRRQKEIRRELTPCFRKSCLPYFVPSSYLLGPIRTLYGSSQNDARKSFSSIPAPKRRLDFGRVLSPHPRLPSVRASTPVFLDRESMGWSFQWRKKIMKASHLEPCVSHRRLLDRL